MFAQDVWMKEKSKVLHDNGVCSLRDPLLERVEIGFGTLGPRNAEVPHRSTYVRHISRLVYASGLAKLNINFDEPNEIYDRDKE